jgi:hypothetical protein
MGLLKLYTNRYSIIEFILTLVVAFKRKINLALKMIECRCKFVSECDDIGWRGREGVKERREGVVGRERAMGGEIRSSYK